MNHENPQSPRKALDFFEEGKRFTEELLKENEQLRLVIAKIKTQKRDLAKQISMTDSPRMARKVQFLEEENQSLKGEVQDLKDQFHHVEDENREFAERYVEVERQNSDLISLYVASYQLHSTLEFDEVVAAVREVVINLVGTEEFAIYLANKDGDTLHRVSEEGVPDLAPESVMFGSGHIGTAAQDGQLFIEENVQGGQRNTGHTPMICIPLTIGPKVAGVIAIYSLLVQKQGLDAVDLELFELLGHHAATALYASQLYMVSERKRSTLEGFIKLMKADMHESA